jgi:hypothetical protein
MATWPTAALNGKPAPIHAGDFDAVGYSTVFQTSSGLAALQDGQIGGSGQSAAAMRGTFPAVTAGGLGSPIVALGALIVVLLYLDHRIAR